MENSEGDLQRKAAEYVHAAALAIDCAADGHPSAFDYLTWADACTVHLPDDPVRSRVQEVRAAALRNHADRECAASAGAGSDALGTALAQLVDDAHRGYASLRHTMEFPASAGFCRASGVQSADVFTRALVLETLANAHRAGAASCRSLLDRGVEYLARARRRQGNGGWAYFPGLLELAPDVDTLAQVTRFLWLAGRADLVERYAIPVFDRYERMSASGSFETWLYDDDERVASIQRHWAASAWGTGADPEVLANLADCIELVAPGRFVSLLRRLRRQLVDAAQDGAWNSTWYHGPYYGTFVSVRALANDAGAKQQVLASSNFLMRTQRDDGGWGWQGDSSDPLSTALAILTLRAMRLDTADRQISRGIECLERGIRENATAAPVPFIKMNLGRASNRDGPVLSFGSPSVTAAYAANALMEWKAGLRAVS